MCKVATWAFSFLCLLPAVSAPVTTLFNTGVDDNGNPLPAGTADPHWTVLVSMDPLFTAKPASVVKEEWPIAPAGPWIANTSKSKWISMGADQNPDANGGGQTGGYHVFHTQFVLSGFDVATVRIDGRWATDNTGEEVLLNGQPLGLKNTVQFVGWTAFSITNGFRDGTNLLEFVVNAAGTGSTTDPTGFRVEFDAYGCGPASAPRIVEQPTGGIYGIGETANIVLRLDCAAGAQVQWRKNGTPVGSPGGPVLSLTNLKIEDSGDYDAVVSNPSGSETSRPANLLVAPRIPGVYGTGVDAQRQLLADGAVDPHYRMIRSADASYPGPDARTVNNAYPVGTAWQANGPVSRWIAPQANQNDGIGSGGGNAAGDYDFELTFDMTGLKKENGRIWGEWACDNSGTLFLNGSLVGSCPGFGSWTPISITRGLESGINHLRFTVNNAGTTVNPMGLRINLTGFIYPDSFFQAPRLSVKYESPRSSVTLAGRKGGRYMIEALGMLDGVETWTEFQNFVLDGAEQTFVDDDSEFLEQRFYRSKLLDPFGW